MRLSTIGQNFPFLNRELQCEQCFEYMVELENVRLQCINAANKLDNCDAFKRQIKIPTIVGMAGIGKSSFAREGAIKHVMKLETDGVTLTDFMKSLKDENCLNLRVSK